MPLWVEAGLWGLAVGSALVLGGAVGYGVRLSSRTIAAIMAFGAGGLISAISFQLMKDAFETGGLHATIGGFVAGAVIYSLANWALAKRGAKHRKRSTGRQPTKDEMEGSGTAMAVGALLDGVPESIAIGLTMLEQGVVSYATVLAIFISNVSEGLSSSAGMKEAGRSAGFIFGSWIAIAVLSGLASLAGYSLFQNVPAEVQAATTALAAGGILAMLIETMIPEAFEGTRDWSGLIAAAGFLVSFALSMLWG